VKKNGQKLANGLKKYVTLWAKIRGMRLTKPDACALPYSQPRETTSPTKGIGLPPNRRMKRDRKLSL